MLFRSRTARSEIVKDVMDYSAAICDAKGEMVAQAKTIAQHLGAIPEAMAAVQAKWAGQLEPGDAVIMNDPYSGGMHLPDIFMFFPIFAGTEILAAYPFAPVAMKSPASIALYGYRDLLHIGIDADATILAETDRFASMIRESFAELQAAVVEERMAV